MAERVRGNDQVRVVVSQALPEAPVARQVGQQFCPPPVRAQGVGHGTMFINAPSPQAATGNSQGKGRDPAVVLLLPVHYSVDAADNRVLNTFGTTMDCERYGRARNSRDGSSAFSPRGREPRHVVRELPQQGVLPQKLVRSHGLGEGEPAVVGPNIHNVRVYLSCSLRGSTKSTKKHDGCRRKFIGAKQGDDEPG